ncbi:MAG: HhH-GPD family protein [Candidatus Collierbacteria bacterium GW2011_GWB2_44_22]|uniref:DNA-3-methyladenine glycosylase II n=1 Tax=Candidatus Collierbacteria bacterium GW2011_GWB2_44_22 TaxID=1618387 RepID=A0A0G1KTG5_9BACT|nr:MAG: HhH-GPD family protein [Candidatus Collierbacteria bacterium GW2011_GWA2_44_13]KKT51169.1 MAG: HhH-GPD family protein [Candidatus Collierbacteria bacterium GW2011_GWB2_44_22]KKT65993.1 MAG: HhH-GPD family protein [Candidatus Collierbacteria bacterium GW2011_GWC2_44_30]
MDITAGRKHLKKDPRMKPLLKRYSVEARGVSEDLFRDLLESIIGQQLSVKAAGTIINRFMGLFPDQKNIKPEDILARDEESLRSVGLSRQKISYLRSLSEFVVSEKIILATLPDLPDEQVISHLTLVKGIGRWTAEMILIFSLGREDVFSVGDLGLRTAVSRIYGVDREDKLKIEKISQTWSPYRSLASLYLWRSLDNI